VGSAPQVSAMRADFLMTSPAAGQDEARRRRPWRPPRRRARRRRSESPPGRSRPGTAVRSRLLEEPRPPQGLVPTAGSMATGAVGGARGDARRRLSQQPASSRSSWRTPALARVLGDHGARARRRRCSPRRGGAVRSTWRGQRKRARWRTSPPRVAVEADHLHAVDERTGDGVGTLAVAMNSTWESRARRRGSGRGRHGSAPIEHLQPRRITAPSTVDSSSMIAGPSGRDSAVRMSPARADCTMRR